MADSSPSSPAPSTAHNRLTASLNAARRGESPTPTRLAQSVLTPTARKQALRDFYNLDRSKPLSATELDREEFDGREYVDKLVKEKDLKTLISMENDLVQGTPPARPGVDGRHSEFGWGEKVACV